MVEEHSAFHVNFECSELGEDHLQVLMVIGHEHLSRPFAFNVRVRTTADIPLVPEDFQSIIAGTATLSFGPDKDHPIYGVVRQVTLVTLRDGAPVWDLLFVPRVRDLELTRGSWIHLDKTPEDIITAAFAVVAEGALQSGDDFEFSLDGTYLPREYVVQYEESVLDFISRQAEHWGIFYFFDHSAEKDKIVFGDMNTHFPQLAGFEEIGFEPRSGTTITESVRSFGAVQRMVEHQISLRDYNYRMPSISLVTPEQEVDADGRGVVHETGDHHWTPDEGLMLAGVRSQERFCRKFRVTATSTVRGLRAGHRFTLVGAEPEQHGLAREYVIVAIKHKYGTGTEINGLAVPYSNELELLPVEVAFRPARITPKPRIYGVMHAKVDSEADDDEVNVPCDEWGRYKVVMPFDVLGTTGGRATCWIRMATAAGGAGFGFAQGLHVNTEVLITHIDGDPDRPVIAGAVGNFEQPPEVRRENANQLLMSSRQGIRLVFSDAK
jgi:type VI secretion system secreted protein VgrG